MANTYYDSQLTAEEIEEVLEAINGILTPANNGKVLAISDGKFEARSVQWGGGEPVLEPLSVTANGDYTPGAGVDGFDEVHVSVPNSYTASDEGKVVSNGALVSQTARASQITQNGTYDTTLNDEVTVNVSGGSSAVVQPLSVTQNGMYNPPSGVDGYAPVTVNVSGGGNVIEFTQNLLYDEYNTNTFQTEPGGIYLWGSAYNGSNFNNADIICGNTVSIVITSGFGRALCIFKARESSTVYNRGGGVYDLSKINANVSILFGAWSPWSSGNQDRAIETGHLYMFMGPQVSTDTPGTFTGAIVVSQLMQGDASHGYHHGAVILATNTTLGYSVSGTNYLSEIGLYGSNIEYHVIP